MTPREICSRCGGRYDGVSSHGPHFCGAPVPRPPKRVSVTHAHEMLAEAFQYAIAELDSLLDRHFTAHRTLVVSNDEGKFWTAAIGYKVLYRSPDGRATLRFARTFAERTPGVVVQVHDVLRDDDDGEHSVRVPALRVVT